MYCGEKLYRAVGKHDSNWREGSVGSPVTRSVLNWDVGLDLMSWRGTFPELPDVQKSESVTVRNRQDWQAFIRLNNMILIETVVEVRHARIWCPSQYWYDLADSSTFLCSAVG